MENFCAAVGSHRLIFQSSGLARFSVSAHSTAAMYFDYKTYKTGISLNTKKEIAVSSGSCSPDPRASGLSRLWVCIPSGYVSLSLI